MKEFGKKYPLVLGIISFFIMFGGIKLVHTEGYVQATILRLVLSALMILAMWPAVQDRWLKFPGTGWKVAFKTGKWLLIGTVVFLFLSLVIGGLLQGSFQSATGAAEESSESGVNPNWLSTLIQTIFYCGSIGIIEELACRRGLFDLGVKQFPNMKNRALWWAVISSFIFGFMHVVTSLSSEPTAIASAIAKTVNSGMFGFILCGIVLESQNIWTVATIHAIADAIPLVIVVFENSDATTTNYVDTAATMGTWFVENISSFIFMLFYLPFVVQTVKKLKAYDAALELKNKVE